MRYRKGSESAQKKKLKISEAKTPSKSNSVQSENMVGVVTRSQKRLSVNSVNSVKNEAPNSTNETSRSASKTRNSSRRALLESLGESSGNATNASTPQSTIKRKIQDKTPGDSTTLSGSRSTSVSRVRRSSRNTKFLSSNDDTTPFKKDNKISNSASKRKESKGRHNKKADLNDVQVESDTMEDNVKKKNKKTGANRSLRSKKSLNFSPTVTDKQKKKTNSKRKSLPTEEDKADHDIEIEDEGEITSPKKSNKAEIMNLSSSPGLKTERGGGEEEQEEVETFNSSDEPSKKTSEIEAHSDAESRMPPMNSSSEGLDEKHQTSYDKFNRNTESENETCKVKSSKKVKGGNNDCSPYVSTSTLTSHKPQLGVCNKVDSEFLSEHKMCSDDEYVKYDSESDVDFNEEATKDCGENKYDAFMEEVHRDVRVIQSTSIKKVTVVSTKKETDSTQTGLPSASRDQQYNNTSLPSESPGHTTKRAIHTSPKVNSCLVLKTQIKKELKSESSDSDSDAESRKAIMESAQKRIIQNISTSESESRKFVKPLLKSSKQKESSDSDSSPENISFSAGRKLAMDSLKNAVESIQLEKQRRKEKRKQRLEKYKQQKEETLIRLKEKRASQEDASCSSSEESGYEEDDLSSTFSRKNETKKQGIKREKENLDDMPQSKAKKIDSDNEAVPKEKKEKKRKHEHRDDSHHYGSLRPLSDDVLENLPDQLPIKLPKLGGDTVSKREKHSKHDRVKDNQLQCRDFRSRNDVDFIPLNTYGATDFGVMPLDTLKKASKSMAEQAAEFRQKMLYGSHIMRIPANSQAIYQQKLKASGKDSFVR